MDTSGRGMPTTLPVSLLHSFHLIWELHKTPSSAEEAEFETMMEKEAGFL